MSIRDDFFTALTNGAKWDVGVSINRTNPLPLDQYSVFKTETELDAYIGGAFAYPGQIIALVDENATTIYYLDQNKVKQPVGIIPEGDGKTIEVSATGAISLLGGVNAANGTLPMIGDDGKLTWKTLEDIGAGDGNDNTTYQFTLGADGKSFSIKTLFNGQPIKGEDDVELDPQVITFDVYTKSEVDAKIGTASTETAEATGVYVAIEAEAARAAAAEKALDDKIGGVNTALADYAKTADVNTELAKKADKAAYDQTVLDLDALEAKVDAFLTGTGTEAALDSLQELIQYIETHDDTDISGILESIQAIENKLAGVDTTVVAYVTSAIEALKIGDYAKAADLTALAGRVETLEGKVDVTKVSEAISAAEGRAATDAATKANAAKEAAIADADGKLALKANAADVYAKTETYSQSEIDELLEGIQAGSSESAASVATKLDNFKKATNLELYGNEEGTGDSRLDALEAVGAQANVIESVVASGTAKITATKSGKTVTIDDAVLVADIKAAKDAADAADAKAAANATAISGLDTRLQAAETKGNDNAAAIAAHATEFATLKGRVDAHDTTLLDKANKSDVYTKEQVNAITGTLDEGKTLVAMIAEKANANNVYTKEQVYTKDETKAEIKKVTDTIGTVTEGKTLVEMIADAQKAATYDDTALTARVKANEDALVIINGEATVEGSIAKAKADALAAVTTLETGAVAANTAAIAKLNGEAGADGSVATIADARIAAALAGADADFDTLKEMSDWLSTHKGSAAEMNTAIENNKKAIDAINDETTGILALAKADTAAQITALDLANTYEAKGAASKALTDAQAYTDGVLVAFKVKNVDGTTLKVSEDGVASVNQVTTDMIVNGTQTLVLNGGSANS